jgi:hypothetical protein
LFWIVSDPPRFRGASTFQGPSISTSYSCQRWMVPRYRPMRPLRMWACQRELESLYFARFRNVSDCWRRLSSDPG